MELFRGVEYRNEHVTALIISLLEPGRQTYSEQGHEGFHGVGEGGKMGGRKVKEKVRERNMKE